MRTQPTRGWQGHELDWGDKAACYRTALSTAGRAFPLQSLLSPPEPAGTAHTEACREKPLQVSRNLSGHKQARLHSAPYRSLGQLNEHREAKLGNVRKACLPGSSAEGPPSKAKQQTQSPKPTGPQSKAKLQAS